MVVWNRNSNLGNMSENRTPLTVGFTADEGKTWVGLQNLEEGAGRTWSCPSITFIEGRAHVLYYERSESADGETRIALKKKSFRVEIDEFFPF